MNSTSREDLLTAYQLVVNSFGKSLSVIKWNKVEYFGINSYFYNDYYGFMIEFAGTYNATIDEKGRVVLPSVFKKELGEHALLPLVIEKNLFKSCLDIYPEIFWKDRVTSFKSTLDPFDEEDDAFLQFFYENFKKVSMAPNGRINIPDEYLGYASLSRNAMFIGMGFSIRLWDTGEYDRTKIDKDTFVQRFREKRKNRGDVK